MPNRSPLTSGDTLQIRLENGCSMNYSILDVIGYGGSSIVYRGQSSSIDNVSRTQIIKEFYPADIHSIERSGSKLVVSVQDSAAFTQRKQEFYAAISKYSQYFESNSNYANARPFLSGEANGTAYAVSDPSQGTVLSEIDHNDLDLYSISRIMYSICSAIQNFHDHGLLYLDCKPDNIFVYNVDRQYHIRLFDFDTVAKISDIQSGKCTYKTYSPGWAPGEQQNWRVSEICQATDIYSVGAVFFYLLTGTKPNNSDIRKLTNSRYPWRNVPSFLSKASDKSLQISQQILSKTLQPAPSSRYGSISRLKEDFQTLSSITKGTYLEDSSIYDELAHGFSTIEQRLKFLTERLTKSYRGLQTAFIVACSILFFATLMRIGQNVIWPSEQSLSSGETPPIEQIHIFNQDFLLQPGAAEKLKVGIYPYNADISTLQYFSQDLSVAWLDKRAGEWFVIAQETWQEDANHNTIISVQCQSAMDEKKVSVLKPTATSEDDIQNALGGGESDKNIETLWND